MPAPTVLRHLHAEGPSPATNAAKVEMIVPHVSAILRTLGLDLDTGGLRDTPRRVAQMFVNESFSGLDPERRPVMTLFDNESGYRGMLLEKDITFFSTCEHHLAPFFGKAHVAYFPQQQLVGLSKLNRLVRYLASKPQTQERLTVEIGTALAETLGTKDVAVALDATHLCVASRGIKDVTSITRTVFVGGRFEEREQKDEFLRQGGAA